MNIKSTEKEEQSALLLWLFFLLLVEIGCFKFVKMLRLSHRGENFVSEALVLSFIGVFLVAAFGFLFLYFISVLKKRFEKHFYLLFFLLLLFVIGLDAFYHFFIASEKLMGSMHYWFTEIIFQFLRSDLIFLIVLFLISWFLLQKTSGLLQKVTWFLLAFLFVFLSFMMSLDVAVVIATGSVGDWYVLKYALNNSIDILTFVQFSLEQVVLMLLPVFCMLLPFLFLRFSWVSEKVQKTRLLFFGWKANAALILLCVLLYIAPHFKRSFFFPQLMGNIFVVLGEQIIEELKPKKITRSGKEIKRAFNTSKISLVQKKTISPTSQSSSLPSKREKKVPFNVITIILETTRAISTTLHRPNLQTMPFLASLARKGRWAEEMYVFMPSTSKTWFLNSCGFYPKLSVSMMEGSKHGIPGVCLPKLLEPLNYRSGFFTSSSLKLEHNDKMLANVGYHDFFGIHSFPKKGYSELMKNYAYEDRVMIDPSMKWIEDNIKKKRPFFLTYATSTAHYPYISPKWFHKKKYNHKSKHIRYNDYLNVLRYTDQFLKELFDRFEKKGLLKNTVFIIYGDHGEAFGEHGMDSHSGIIWDEGLHVPAIILAPNLKPGKIKGLRQNIDIVPTILDLLGLEAKGGSYIGLSMLRPEIKQRRLFFSCRFERSCLAMRVGSMKFIYHYKKRAMEVFDILNDPREKKNVSFKFKKEELKKAKQRMLHWHRQINFHYEQFALRASLKKKR